MTKDVRNVFGDNEKSLNGVRCTCGISKTMSTSRHAGGERRFEFDAYRRRRAASSPDGADDNQPFDRPSVSLLAWCSASPSRMSLNRDKMRVIESNSRSCSSTHSLMVGSMLCTVCANSVTRLYTLSSSCSLFSSLAMTGLRRADSVQSRRRRRRWSSCCCP